MAIPLGKFATENGDLLLQIAQVSCHLGKISRAAVAPLVQSTGLVPKTGELLAQARKAPIHKTDAPSPHQKGKHACPLPNTSGEEAEEWG